MKLKINFTITKLTGNYENFIFLIRPLLDYKPYRPI